MSYIFSQIMVALCFLGLVIVLFFEEKDYLTYSVLFLLISAIATAIQIPAARELETYMMAIEWEVIFFLIAMFTIVEILNEARLFHEIAKKIVNRYKTNIRKLFWVICLTSTLSASIIEDLSVALIFIPIIILTCEEVHINPAPFLLGMTICINLASTLTPFGSAENIMIANHFDLGLYFFLTNLGPYFVITTLITLALLDRFVLTKELETEWVAHCEDRNDGIYREEAVLLENISSDPVVFKKNLIGLAVFVVMLVFIHEIHLAGLLGMLMFVFLNPREDKNKKSSPSLSYFLGKVDFKLIFFFICLFLLVGLMDLNGTVFLLEHALEDNTPSSIFSLCLVILVLTSLLSGLMDNAPVTIIFLPIISILVESSGFPLTPLIVAFVLGINLGGNFLPQGSAADMMTLELSQKYCVEDLTFKRLFKVGGTFAGIHVLLGIGYLAFMIFVFPGF